MLNSFHDFAEASDASLLLDPHHETRPARRAQNVDYTMLINSESSIYRVGIRIRARIFDRWLVRQTTSISFHYKVLQAINNG